MLAPLQLINYRAAVRSYERFDDVEVSDDNSMGIALRLQFNHDYDEDTETQRLKLVVQYNQDEDVPEEQKPFIAHRGEIGVEGWLRWISKEIAEREDADRLMRANGLSMLYGIARVRVADLTDQGNGSRLLLPSVNFQNIVEEDESGQ